MRIDSLLTDDAVLAELGTRLQRARLARNVTRAQLAEEAGVGERTVARLEAGASTTLTNLVRILRPLGLLESLDALVPEQTVDPFAALPRRGRVRRRASRAGAAGGAGGAVAAPEGRWVWGDERDDGQDRDAAA
jgi:transcriptional regulator with XRE-family HTH domain